MKETRNSRSVEVKFTDHAISTIVDASLAQSAIENYVDMQQRFLAGDWKPAELNGGRLCEAVARCIHQLDTNSLTHSKLPGKICEIRR